GHCAISTAAGCPAPLRRNRRASREIGSHTPAANHARLRAALAHHHLQQVRPVLPFPHYSFSWITKQMTKLKISMEKQSPSLDSFSVSIPPYSLHIGGMWECRSPSAKLFGKGRIGITVVYTMRVADQLSSQVSTPISSLQMSNSPRFCRQ